jgi:predicted RNA-binding Zn-ribbon protein involved in translation (DUF1610 family)
VKQTELQTNRKEKQMKEKVQCPSCGVVGKIHRKNLDDLGFFSRKKISCPNCQEEVFFKIVRSNLDSQTYKVNKDCSKENKQLKTHSNHNDENQCLSNKDRNIRAISCFLVFIVFLIGGCLVFVGFVSTFISSENSDVESESSMRVEDLIFQHKANSDNSIKWWKEAKKRGIIQYEDAKKGIVWVNPMIWTHFNRFERLGILRFAVYWRWRESKIKEVKILSYKDDRELASYDLWGEQINTDKP